MKKLSFAQDVSVKIGSIGFGTVTIVLVVLLCQKEVSSEDFPVTSVGPIIEELSVTLIPAICEDERFLNAANLDGAECVKYASKAVDICSRISAPLEPTLSGNRSDAEDGAQVRSFGHLFATCLQVSILLSERDHTKKDGG